MVVGSFQSIFEAVLRSGQIEGPKAKQEHQPNCLYVYWKRKKVGVHLTISLFDRELTQSFEVTEEHLPLLER